MAELLASALTGSLSSVNAPPLKTTEGAPHDLGQTYILIDPNFNGEKDHFFEQINSLTELISSQPNARLPGSNKNNPSETDIDKDLWDLVNKLAELN
jgi:(2R)-3-sulfolactate dehydrogenase (NADP+)